MFCWLTMNMTRHICVTGYKFAYFAILCHGWFLTRDKSKQNNSEEPKISSERGGKQLSNKLLVTICLLQLDLQIQFKVLDFPFIFWTLRQSFHVFLLSVWYIIVSICWCWHRTTGYCGNIKGTVKSMDGVKVKMEIMLVILSVSDLPLTQYWSCLCVPEIRKGW